MVEVIAVLGPHVLWALLVAWVLWRVGWTTIREVFGRVNVVEVGGVRVRIESGVSPTSATRGQNACNVLIFRSCKPKVGTTRHGAEERGRGAQTQIRGGGWAGKFSLSC